MVNDSQELSALKSDEHGRGKRQERLWVKERMPANSQGKKKNHKKGQLRGKKILWSAS